MNGPSAAEVDAVVRAVLTGRAGGAGLDRDSSIYGFAGRVLTLRVVSGLPETIRQVVVGCETVVTPMARDALRQRGVVVSIESGPAVPAGVEWALASDGDSPRFEAYRRAVLGGPGAWRHFGPDLDRAVAWWTASGARAGVVLSACAAGTVWRLHRFARIRAAQVHDAESLGRAGPFQPNVVVVEPAATSLAEWRHLVGRFQRSFMPARG
ncbi:MAG: hypothetical protein KatS3mg108_1381 [Isosphaeraceae bacterium]|jgi:hypothetical protein|nr:MAG: hypothetical protein KatS3mg108_1381 [Isosphaeraceae bacterium]